MGSYSDFRKGQAKGPAAPKSEFTTLGFLQNMVGDLGEIGAGLGSLGINLVKDVAGETAQDFTQILPESLEYNHSSTIDDILEAAPKAIVGDYKKRYGSGLDQFALSTYEDPLAFLGDVATVLSAGGYAAARGAQAASRVPAVAEDLARLGRLSQLGIEGAGTGGWEAGRVARVADKILPGLKDRAALEAAGVESKVPLAGTRKVLDPATGRTISEEARLFNPYRRAFRENITEAVSKGSIGRYEKELNRLQELVDSGDATRQQQADLALLGDVIERAQGAGIKRIYQPANIESLGSGVRKIASQRKVRKATQELIGESTFAHVGARDQFTKSLTEKLENLDEAQADNFHVTMQFDTPQSHGRVPFDELSTRLDEIAEQSPKGRELADALEADVELVNTIDMPGSLVNERVTQQATKDYLDSLKQEGRTFEQLFVSHVDQLDDAERAALDSFVTNRVQNTSEKAKRYLEGVSEGYLSETPETSALSDAFDDVNVLRHRELTKAFSAEKGADAYADAFDYSYQPLQLALERRIAGHLPNKNAPFEQIVNDLYEKLGSPKEVPSTLEIDDAMQALGRKMPGYFPKIFPTGNRSDFLMKIGGQTRGLRSRSYPARFKKGEGVLLRDFLQGQKKSYVTNPAEAYTRAASQIIRHQETEKFIEEFATSLGRPVQAWEQLGEGEALVNLDAVKMMLRKNSESLKRVDDYIQAGQEIDKAFVKGVRESLDGIPDEMRQLLSEQGRLYAVPKVAAKQLEALARQSVGGKSMRLFFDGPVNLWRNLTLYFRPGYYLNNALGNTTFLKLQGGKMSGVFRQLDRRYLADVRAAIPEDILPEVESGFYSDVSQRTTNLGEAANTATGRAITRVKSSTPGRGAGRVRDELQDFNAGLENLYRRESYLTAVEKQASERGVKLAGTSLFRSKKRLEQIAEFGADPQIAKRALDDLNATMNNYNALAPWERNYVRRFIAPFYPFYKHSARTLISMPFKHPAKARLLDWFYEVDKEMQDLGPLPEWLESSVPIGPGADEGETRFASTRGSNPFQGVTENPLSLLNPFLQVGLEQTTGRDTFTGRDFTKSGVYNDPISGQQFQMDENGIPQPLERRFGNLLAPVTPGAVETVAQMVPFVDLYRDLRSEGARYSAEDEVMTDPNTGEVRYPTDPIQELLKYIGVSTLDFNVPEYQAKLTEAQRRALGALTP